MSQVETGQQADERQTSIPLPLDQLAFHHLNQHPQFRNRTSSLRIESYDETIVVTGRLPSFYLKQLLQEVLKRLPVAESIDNQVDVVSNLGVSSVRRPK